MSKRKACNEIIEECKKFRDDNFSEKNIVIPSHEKDHLLHTNNTLSDFVHKSINVIVSQRDEIEHLNLVISELRQALVTSESKNIHRNVDMDVF